MSSICLAQYYFLFYSLVPGIYDLSYGEVLPIQTSSPQPNLVYRHYLITNIGSHSRLFWLIIPPAIAEFVRFRDLIADFIKETGNSTITRSIEIFFQQNIDQNAFIRLLHENNVMEALKVAINQLWSLVSQTFDFIIAILGFAWCSSIFFHLVRLREII